MIVQGMYREATRSIYDGAMPSLTNHCDIGAIIYFE